ncbi:unnamed protein product [Closterium sp. Naga37s-1]|nr:unnamed protein product [Closterium sp. Naga37s-1]
MAAISSIAAAAMAASSAPMAALTRTVMSSPLASSMLPIANSLPSAGLSAAHAPQQLQCQDRASNVGRRSVATPAKSTAAEAPLDVRAFKAEHGEAELETDPARLWERYVAWLYKDEALGLELDISRMGVTDAFVQAMEPKVSCGSAYGCCTWLIGRELYVAWLYKHKHLGLELDVSRMGVTDAFAEVMEPKFAAAFKAMVELERGAMSNPDERRMVGHFWLRHHLPIPSLPFFLLPLFFPLPSLFRYLPLPPLSPPRLLPSSPPPLLPSSPPPLLPLSPPPHSPVRSSLQGDGRVGKGRDIEPGRAAHGGALLATVFAAAFKAMDELEKGAISNPDERRMVGHYWLRKPQIAASPTLRKEIEETIDAVDAFATAVVNGTVRWSGVGKRGGRRRWDGLEGLGGVGNSRFAFSPRAPCTSSLLLSSHLPVCDLLSAISPLSPSLTPIKSPITHNQQIKPPPCPAGRFTQVLSVGIGGSALGPQFVSEALAGTNPPLQVRFVDNTDPAGIDRQLDQIGAELSSTLVLVISKSGGTPETRNGLLEVQRVFREKGLDFARQGVAITQRGSLLDDTARMEGWLARFPMFDWIGGRTSEVSAVGLLPAALQGINIREMLRGAGAMDEATRVHKIRSNPAALLALCWYWGCDGIGSKDMVVLPYKDSLLLFSRYLQQLIMESVGKEFDLDGKRVNQGLTVYGNKGSTDQHAYIQQLREGVPNFFATFIEVLTDRQSGRDWELEPGVTCGDYLFGLLQHRWELEPGVTCGDYLFGLLQVGRGVGDGERVHVGSAERRGTVRCGDYLFKLLQGTRSALYANKRESITLTIKDVDAATVGAIIALYERATGLYASLINVNAYHQPGLYASLININAYHQPVRA